jgi:hypothetical protein
VTLGLALVIVLGFLVIGLGFAVYHLTTRISSLETAIDGGLRSPDRPLAPAEFAARFATASERASLAAELGDGVCLFLGDHTAGAAGLLDVVANLATGRGLTLVFSGEAPEPRWPSDVTVRTGFGPRFEPAGIVATPFGMTIHDGRVLEAKLLGSDAALHELLGTPPRTNIQPTPLEVD